MGARGPKHTHPHRTPRPGMVWYRRRAHTNTHAPNLQPGLAGCKPKPKPNLTHHKHQQRRVGRSPNRYPSTHTQDPSQDWRSYRETQTQTQAPHNSRKSSVHRPGTEAARAMQVTRRNEIRRPGVRLHPKACAASGLQAERATPKHLGTPVPRTCMHALGTGYARKSSEPVRFRPKEGTCASTVQHPLGVTSTSGWRRSGLPMLPGGCFVGGHQSGLAGCKSPPLFTRGASSCPSQPQRQRQPWGAPPPPSAPTYLPSVHPTRSGA